MMLAVFFVDREATVVSERRGRYLPMPGDIITLEGSDFRVLYLQWSPNLIAENPEYFVDVVVVRVGRFYRMKRWILSLF